jgi:cobalamin biosynthesis protein CobD/CbiB
MPRNDVIPDMRFINRKVPIAEVACALGLRLEGAGKLHCWHPDLGGHPKPAIEGHFKTGQR